MLKLCIISYDYWYLNIAVNMNHEARNTKLAFRSWMQGSRIKLTIHIWVVTLYINKSIEKFNWKMLHVLAQERQKYCNVNMNSIQVRTFTSSPSEVFLRKGVLKICSKPTGKHPCRSVSRHCLKHLRKKYQHILLKKQHGCTSAI